MKTWRHRSSDCSTSDIQSPRRRRRLGRCRHLLADGEASKHVVFDRQHVQWIRAAYFEGLVQLQALNKCNRKNIRGGRRWWMTSTCFWRRCVQQKVSLVVLNSLLADEILDIYRAYWSLCVSLFWWLILLFCNLYRNRSGSLLDQSVGPFLDSANPISRFRYLMLKIAHVHLNVNWRFRSFARGFNWICSPYIIYSISLQSIGNLCDTFQFYFFNFKVIRCSKSFIDLVLSECFVLLSIQRFCCWNQI